MKKLSAKIGLVKRLQPFLPSHIIHKLYTPLLQSHIDYCLTVWGKCFSTELCKLQRLQNQAARVFSKNFNKNVSLNNILNRLGWMTVSHRYKFLTSCFIYKCLNDHNVQYNMENTFISKFKYANESHQHNARFANNDCLTIPVTKTTCFKSSLSYNGVLIWNNIPADIRDSNNLSNFKDKFKSYLIKGK